MEGFTITDLFSLPPGFRASAVSADPFMIATQQAEACEPGTVFWDNIGGRCRVAVVLAPDLAISERTLIDLGLLALYDALAVLAPPQVPIDVGNQDCLVVDGGRAAWVRTAATPGSLPDWAVIGIEVVLTAAPGTENPGDALEDTCLAEEGFGAVTVDALLAGFCRHLLAWIDTWRDEGAGALAHAVELRRAVDRVRA